MNSDLAGVLPAVVTPFTSGEQFAPQPFEALLDRLYSAGSHGIYVCGQTGEGLLQPRATRQMVAEAAVSLSPRGKTVVIHTGCARTEDAVALTRHASRIGAHAVSSLPPAGSYGFAEMKSYYQAIAAVSDIPVLVYFFPEVSQAISSVEQIEELCSIPGVVGLKFTDFNLFKLSLIARSGRTIFNGRDEVFAAGMLMGASGGIGTFYNVAPGYFVQIYDLCREGRWAEARQLQDRVNDLIALTIRFPVFPAIKSILKWSGIDCGPCLEPRRPLTADEERELRSALEKAEFDPSGSLRVTA